MSNKTDIRENEILVLDEKLLPILLIDRTRSNGETHNLIWATDNYEHFGDGYHEWDEMTVQAITGENGLILRPRVNKSRAEQECSSRDKAEVFTPVWICNNGDDNFSTVIPIDTVYDTVADADRSNPEIYEYVAVSSLRKTGDMVVLGHRYAERNSRRRKTEQVMPLQATSVGALLGILGRMEEYLFDDKEEREDDGE